MFDNIKDIVVPASILLGLGIIAGIVGKITGEDPPPPPPSPLPTSGDGLPNEWADGSVADLYARRMFEAMDGVQISNESFIERFDRLTEFVNLPTDDMFIAVNNRFNQAYGKGQSLREWINNEYLLPENLLTRINQRYNLIEQETGSKINGVHPVGSIIEDLITITTF